MIKLIPKLLNGLTDKSPFNIIQLNKINHVQQPNKNY